MKKLLLLLFLGFTLVGFSQTTVITDANFEQALIDLGIDTAPIDGSVPTANISGVTILDVKNKNISYLTGIEDFTALTYLRCSENQLTSLDVNNNTALNYLYCYNNQLESLNLSNNTALIRLHCENNQLTSSLDLSNNTALTELVCRSNQLTSLDMSNNTALNYLDCRFNQLTSLNVSNNISLTVLACANNQLTSLDVSNNTALTYLDCDSNQLESLDVRNENNINFTDFDSTNNPNLTCIYVDAADWSTDNWTNIDATSTFVNDEAACGVLSLEDNAFELNVTIHPNPTDNYLFIEGNKNPISISIYNLLGKEVLSINNTKNINVQALPSGVYVIRISDGVRQTNMKFTKN